MYNKQKLMSGNLQPSNMLNNNNNHSTTEVMLAIIVILTIATILIMKDVGDLESALTLAKRGWINGVPAKCP